MPQILHGIYLFQNTNYCLSDNQIQHPEHRIFHLEATLHLAKWTRRLWTGHRGPAEDGEVMRDYESGKWNPQRLPLLCSQNPGWWVCALSTLCPLKDSRGEKMRKLAQGICHQNGFRLLNSTGDKCDILRKKDTQTGFLYSNQTSHKGESRIKTLRSHRVPGHCLRMLWRKWSIHPNQGTKQERGRRVSEKGDRKGPPRWEAAPGGPVEDRPGGCPSKGARGNSKEAETLKRWSDFIILRGEVW